MASSAGQLVIRHLRRATHNGDGNESDADLLESFVSRRDELAFSTLVRRHGPMVLGVCRRVIRRHADAEDAFQATFLVLSRKAASLMRRDLLANWLYGVAYRTALEARTRMLRRYAAERQLEDLPQPDADPVADRSELIALLDRELNGLADKYRVPVVLCELEGHSRKETARMLGIPEGTLSSRLAAARRTLAARLAQRGVAVSAAAVLSQMDASASVPARLIESTVRAATGHAAGATLAAPVAALTQGVLKSMFITKLKLAAALVVAAVITVGGLSYTMVGSRIAAAPQDDNQKTAQKPAPAKQPPLAGQKKTDFDLLQGAWKVTDASGPGHRGLPKDMVFYFVKQKVYLGTAEKIEVECDLAIDSAASPRQLTLTMPEETKSLQGIYSLKGDALKLAFGEKPGDERPKDFEGKEHVIFVLQHDPNAKVPDLKDRGNKIKTAAARTRSANNMKQILLAMHNYHDANGVLPAAAIVDKNGKPLLSWRVNLLPYVEQDALYRAFKLDEPWDSEHNKKLMARMPKVFGDKGTKTHYRIFVGEGAGFESKKSLKFADFTDGTSNTLLIVEAADPVEWTRPEEFEYAEKKPLPKLGGTPFENGFHIGMADGSVRFMSTTATEKTIRAIITRNGGEVLEP
jgi:RNA polymerase sigma factor (sigma-70 family)